MRETVATDFLHRSSAAITETPVTSKTASRDRDLAKNAFAKKTIVVNALSALQGGGQTYLINLFRYLPADFSARIYVIAPDSLPLPTDDERVVRMGIPALAARNPYARAVWEKLRMKKFLKSLGADILFCPGGIIGGDVPAGCRMAITFQNMIPFSPKQTKKYGVSKMRLRNWILGHEFRRSMARADLVICLSDHARKVAEAEVEHGLKSVVRIPHGVSPEFRQSDSSNARLPAWLPASGYFLYVSTLDHYKAQIEVVKAFALLKHKRDGRKKLVLIGPEYAEYGARVRECVRALGLEGEVVIHAALPHSEMPAIYRHAVLNIFASECENCPNVLIEALAAGRPVLCSNVPPMPETAGNAAVYFDPISPEDLAEKWAAVLADPQWKNDLSARAEEQSRLYSWPESARRTWDAIGELARR
jgi:glycosyltransferase involved in cell wall biosynthesis